MQLQPSHTTARQYYKNNRKSWEGFDECSNKVKRAFKRLLCQDTRKKRDKKEKD